MTDAKSKAQAKTKRRARQDADDMRWLLSDARTAHRVSAVGRRACSACRQHQCDGHVVCRGRAKCRAQMLARVMTVQPDAYALMVKETPMTTETLMTAAAADEQ